MDIKEILSKLNVCYNMEEIYLLQKNGVYMPKKGKKLTRDFKMGLRFDSIGEAKLFAYIFNHKELEVEIIIL